ncbi:MAG TPA: hypothetical protein VNJ53_01535 [Gaiellaceae bacterium]|nr:hypothetical protein [Gaiellaceae bacterium]
MPDARTPLASRRARSALRLLEKAAAAAEAGWAPWAVLGVSVAVWWVQAAIIPLAGGRDFGTYAGAYVELFQSDPVDLGYVLGRTPVAPLVVGALLDPLGGALAEVGMSLLYAAAVTCWFLAARLYGGAAALLTVVVLWLYPGYGILLHELASDAVFAVAFAGWALLLVRVLHAPSAAGYALAGAGVGLLVLVRPGNQALLVLGALALAAALPWRARLVAAASFVAAGAVVLGAWTVHNGVRFGDYTIARGGNSRLPFERVFLTERIVRAENGPASRRLAEAVRRELLLEEPYRSYGIGPEDFFADPSPRMKEDLGALATRLWGWESDERILRDVGLEAVRAHPGRYVRGVLRTILDQLRLAVYRAGVADPAGGEEVAPGSPGDAGATIVVEGRRLPKPSEGERIPAPHEGGPTTPDGSIRTVWTSPSEHHLVFDRPEDERRYRELHRRIGELTAAFPDRAGSATLAHRLNQASRWFPPPLLWLALGLVVLAWRRPTRALALAAPALAGLAVIAVNALAIAAVPHYAVPVVPAFVLLAAGALLGPRPPRPEGAASAG